MSFGCWWLAVVILGIWTFKEFQAACIDWARQQQKDEDDE